MDRQGPEAHVHPWRFYSWSVRETVLRRSLEIDSCI
jgi:hypothetical protein